MTPCPACIGNESHRDSLCEEPMTSSLTNETILAWIAEARKAPESFWANRLAIVAQELLKVRHDMGNMALELDDIAKGLGKLKELL